METGKKFRNHISIVAEETWSGILVLLVFGITQVLPELAEASAEDVSFLADRTLWITLGLGALLAVFLGNRFLVWARTYIYIVDNTIVIEKNTVNKKKNTIGIRNISNINLEQNLFEMLIGTCKVKMDTNSLSTADKTDVKIILKKEDAENFRREIMARMQMTGAPAVSFGEGSAVDPGAADFADSSFIDGSCAPGMGKRVTLEEDYDIRADFGDIIRHGLYSVNIFSVLLLLGGAAATAGAVVQVMQNPGLVKSLLGAAAGILVAASIVFSALWDTVKDFVKYYDFRAKRRGDRLFIRYGLLKKIEYTVPVDKIQALKINQSLVARLGHRYMAEIVNVGMGDESQEKNSFLVLYCTKEEMRRRLDLLLPELGFPLDQEVKRQPRSVWAVWMLPFLVYVLAVGFSALVGIALTDGMESGDKILALAGIWGGAALLILFVLAGMGLSYKTAGAGAGEKTLTLCRGYFGRHYTIVKYSKIQYARFSENFLARKCGIRKGAIHLLASAGNASHDIPWFQEGLEEKVKAGMLAK